MDIVDAVSYTHLDVYKRQLLEDCGFTRAEAVRATGQLVMRNIENVLEAGCDGALTLSLIHIWDRL